MPPSCRGASLSPFSTEGGFTLIRIGFQTFWSEASKRMRPTPTKMKKAAKTPKKPT
jgi:hypothetical protein